MKLDNLIDSLLEEKHIYDHCDKIIYLKRIIEGINDIFLQEDSAIGWFLDPNQTMSLKFYSLLREENRKRVINRGSLETNKDIHISNKDIPQGSIIIIDSVKDRDEKDIEIPDILRNKNYKIINVYEFLKTRDIFLKDEREENYGILYEDIYAQIKCLKNQIGDLRKPYKKIIGYFYFIRDFVNAFRFSKEFIASKVIDETEMANYKEAMSGVKKLLSQASRKISRNNHVVLNWVDNIRYDEIKDMPFLSRKASEGVSFERMYAHVPYTHGTLNSLFMGKTLIDEKGFMVKDEEYKESRLYHIIKENDMEFIPCSSAYSFDIFHNIETRKFDFLYIKRNTIPGSLLMFEGLSEILESKKQCFAWIHLFEETHWPYMNPLTECLPYDTMSAYYTKDNEEYSRFESQCMESKKYLDEQIAFYDEFYKGDVTTVYLSDHGHNVGERPIAMAGLHHVMFFISSKVYRNESVNGMYSLCQFPEIFSSILKNEGNLPKALDYVYIQRDDIYSQLSFERLKECKIKDPALFAQFRGIVTDRDCYVRYVTGEESYQLLSDNKNEIENEKYSKRIEELKETVGDVFIDIEEYEKYQYALKLYDGLGIHLKEGFSYI